MSFQFQCPHGHLLQGDASRAGQQCSCPICGVLFLVPSPPPAAPPFAEHPQTAPSASPSPPTHLATPPSSTAFPLPAEPELLHIACPNGHELETPVDMLEQDVLCPHCQVQFRLRRKDSVEYKRKRDLEQQRRDHRIGKAWLNWAVVIAVLVGIALVLMILSSTRQ